MAPGEVTVRKKGKMKIKEKRQINALKITAVKRKTGGRRGSFSFIYNTSWSCALTDELQKSATQTWLLSDGLKQNAVT